MSIATATLDTAALSLRVCRPQPGVFIQGGDETMYTTTMRVKAFSGSNVKLHKIAVDAHGAVLVWDDVAGHYTRCHSLSPTATRMALARAESASRKAEHDDQ